MPTTTAPTSRPHAPAARGDRAETTRPRCILDVSSVAAAARSAGNAAATPRPPDEQLARSGAGRPTLLSGGTPRDEDASRRSFPAGRG